MKQKFTTAFVLLACAAVSPLLAESVYISDRGSGQVYIIDTAIGMVAIGGSITDAIALTPDDQFAYVTDYAASPWNVYAVDTSTTTLSATVTNSTAIPFSRLVGTAVLNDLPIAYVARENTVGMTPEPGTVYIIDTSTNTTTMAGIVSPGIFPAFSLPTDVKNFVSFTPSAAPLPPERLGGAQRKNNFGLEYALFNRLAWSANIAGYNIYRNGIKIATVGSSTFDYKDSGVSKGVTYQYSVTAFNASGTESAPIDVNVS